MTLSTPTLGGNVVCDG